LTLAQKANNLRPDDPAVMDTLGWIYYKNGDTNKALDFIGKANAKAAQNAVINYHMGMVLYKVGRLSEAKEQLKKALASKEDFEGKEEAKKTLEKM